MQTANVVPPWAVRVVGAVSLLCMPAVALADHWTEWYSEEDGDLICPPYQVARGFGCLGDYCDSLRLLCWYTFGNIEFSNYYWSQYISEETYTDDWNVQQHICTGPGGALGVVNGVSCDGPYCDNISLHCQKINVPLDHCIWTDWMSEEQGSIVFPDPNGYSRPRWLVGLECRGDYCDEKRFYACAPSTW
jgi:hypothetical protein